MIGFDFIGLQVRDVARAADFYERIGLTRGTERPDAVVFETAPIPFAVRTPLPGTDLDAGPVGLGAALWLGVDDPEGLHDRLAADGVEIVRPVAPSPFGLHFAFRDPDGYVITAHEAQPA
ncbi:VOC family protein [Ruania alba]|uniref:VOC domain-containing protein n=1 Tax=Ruania alba TaxID=648782 RepID=A0A1H5MXZ8_9MICO|nr:VOC family protein [Ruania alba]SEE93248.1 hypothetical protein SAMN04488554_3673 [Ruania alba]